MTTFPLYDQSRQKKEGEEKKSSAFWRPPFLLLVDLDLETLFFCSLACGFSPSSSVQDIGFSLALCAHNLVQFRLILYLFLNCSWFDAMRASKQSQHAWFLVCSSIWYEI